MQKPLVRATVAVNGSSSGGREERESVIRIGGEENAFSTKTRHGVITVGTQWYVWEDCRLSYSWRRQPRTIRDKPSPKMVCRRDVDPDTAPRNHRGASIYPADGYRLPESASSLRPPRSLDNQLFRREKFQADLLFPTIFSLIPSGVNINR